jgi:ubiquinone/menaquinone biosynthesis C-methylase UbiE
LWLGDERYTKDPEPFDWYQRYSGIKEKLRSYIKESDHILQLGCGNSRMTEDMYDDGFTSIANIDISKVCIEQMQERHKDKGTLTWQVMNACHLDFPDETFNCIIDKGTMDSILCGEGSTGNVAKMLSECVRVLKPNGVFFMVSYGIPDNRLGYLESEEYPWKVSVSTVAKPTVSANAVADSKDSNSVHYIFVAVKQGEEEEK